MRYSYVEYSVWSGIKIKEPDICVKSGTSSTNRAFNAGIWIQYYEFIPTNHVKKEKVLEWPTWQHPIWVLPVINRYCFQRCMPYCNVCLKPCRVRPKIISMSEPRFLTLLRKNTTKRNGMSCVRYLSAVLVPTVGSTPYRYSTVLQQKATTISRNGRSLLPFFRLDNLACKPQAAVTGLEDRPKAEPIFLGAAGVFNLEL